MSPQYWFKAWLTFPAIDKECFSNDKDDLITRLTVLCFGYKLGEFWINFKHLLMQHRSFGCFASYNYAGAKERLKISQRWFS